MSRCAIFKMIISRLKTPIEKKNLDISITHRIKGVKIGDNL